MIRSLLVLLVAGVAQAQPAEDPGIAESPTPPAPPAGAAPAPRGSATTLAPAERPAPAATVDESVSVKTEWEDQKQESGELDQHVAAPTMTGGVGLLRTQSGSIGNPGSFRIGLHAGVFQQDQLVAGASGSNAGDSNTRFTGDLTISYTPWKYLEAYFGLYNTSNENARNDPGRTDPKLLTSLADFALGLKGRYPVARFTDLALRAEVKFLNSVNSSGIEGSATNASFDLIASFDLRHATRTSRVPLRFHINFGYLYDNSLALLPSNQCATSTANDACIRSRAVQEFAYGIGSQRLRLALAADVPAQVKLVGVQPFFEYHLEAALGDGDPVMARVLRGNDGRTLQYLTFGLRLRPVAGLILDAGLDVGLQSPGWQFGPPLPQWNVLLGAAYAYEFAARKTKVVTRTVTRETARAPVEGRVRGMIRDARTKKPLGGAAVKYVNRLVTGQVSGEDGVFVSYGFAPGPLTVEVARDDYEPLKVDVRVAQNADTPVELLLVPKPPPAGQMRMRVSDPAGGAIGMATVRVRGAGAPIDADNDGAGAFSAKLDAGEYIVDVFADNFLGSAQKVTVAAGQVQALTVTLPKKPAVAHLTVAPDAILLKGSLKFSPGNQGNQLTPADQLLLDEVADVLIKNAQIKKLRIEAHLDNNKPTAVQVTKDRAAAVSAYLQKRGIDSSRLEADGFGGSQPLAPNLTAANRARNRRVAFKILN